MVLMSALGHALRRVLPCARMSGGLLGHRAYSAQALCCGSLSVLVACVHSCVSGWELTVSQMSWVGAMAVLGLCATARNVPCTFLGMSATCSSSALPCSLFGTEMLPCLGPVLSLSASLFGGLMSMAVAHFVMDCFDLLHAPDDDVSDDSSNQP